LPERRLRVGMVFYTHPSFRERAIPHVESEIAEQLVRLGHEVLAYCPVDRRAELPPWRGLKLIGVRCRTIVRPRWAIGVELPLRVALRLDPGLDALVLNGEQGAWIAFLAARRRGTLGVMAIHGLIDGVIGYRRATSRRLRLRDWLLRHLLSFGERLGARTADLCIPGSRRLVPELTGILDIPPSRIVPIPNGVSPRPARTPVDRISARERLGLPPGAFLAVFVGADYRRKGLAVARQAVEGARSDGIPAMLLTAGCPPARTVSETGFGWVDEPRKWDVFAAGDVFLFPTQYEAYSLAVREAASIGLPILTTPQSGVDEGENGIDYVLCDPGDVQGFTSALIRAYRDPKWAARMGERGRALLAGWTYERQGAAWSAALAHATAQRRSAGETRGPIP
jgi:glycosyltransferase involved in cell wall biosynthesis